MSSWASLQRVFHSICCNRVMLDIQDSGRYETCHQQAHNSLRGAAQCPDDRNNAMMELFTTVGDEPDEMEIVAESCIEPLPRIT